MILIITVFRCICSTLISHLLNFFNFTSQETTTIHSILDYQYHRYLHKINAFLCLLERGSDTPLRSDFLYYSLPALIQHAVILSLTSTHEYFYFFSL